MSVRSYKGSPPSSRRGVGPGQGTKCEALYDFKGASAEDLPFKKGDILLIKSTSEDPNWWFATMGGKEGMIPANYVQPIGGGSNADGPKTPTLPRDAKGELVPMPWFHGKIGRDQAERLMQPRENGLFMIRESSNYPGDYTLCVCCDGVIDHYRIQTIDGRLSVDEEEFFADLDGLIEHYKKAADGLCTKLVKPLIKRGGAEFKIDADKFKELGYHIEARKVVKTTKLGQGQFGDVFEGTYNGEKVAIKMLKEGAEAASSEFLDEAAVMTKMKHRNLVQLIGVTFSGGLPSMILSEFCAKGCLLDYLRSRGRAGIVPAVQLSFTKDINQGMCYLEEKNFVHRDLAARNVLLADFGKNAPMAKVADFGLAKDSERGEVDIGKLPIKWTAPEALRQKVSTSKSDVWSYGVCMWEIYSFGRAPYPRMSQKDVVEKVLEGHRMERPDTCPEDLYNKVMLWCWEIDAKNRPSFKQLSDKLKKFSVQ